MKTLLEIIEQAKDGGMPTHEECYWAMLALDALSTLDRTIFCKEMLKEPATRIEFRRMYAENSHTSWQAALNKSPKDWLGPNHDPSNPEYQRMRKIHKGIFDKFMGAEKHAYWDGYDCCSRCRQCIPSRGDKCPKCGSIMDQKSPYPGELHRVRRDSRDNSSPE